MGAHFTARTVGGMTVYDLTTRSRTRDVRGRGQDRGGSTANVQPSPVWPEPGGIHRPGRDRPGEPLPLLSQVTAVPPNAATTSAVTSAPDAVTSLPAGLRWLV